MVYDLGSGTFDVTIVRYTPTRYQLLATYGDVLLGGLDWTRRIVDHVCEHFVRRFGSDPCSDAQALVQLTRDCENSKRDLNQQQDIDILVRFAGNTVKVPLTQREFERMTADLLQRTRDTTELVLQEAGMTASMLDEVLLVGGSTHMPAVEQMLLEVC